VAGMTIGIVVFPGSNCDADTYHAVRDVLGRDAVYVWHEETALDGLDAIVLPGGFAHGDYLRAGAIAATSPVMGAVRRYAAGGRPVFGICNGFQVLLETRLLPGALLLNSSGEFRCRDVRIRVERTDTPFTGALRAGDVLRLPIAHGEGRYYADAETLASLRRNRQIAFRYCDADGRITDAANPNGALENIAGVAAVSGTVLGLMPHPERASEAILGSADGLRIFESLAAWIDARKSGVAAAAAVGAAAGGAAGPRPGAEAR
jgi:phosphoribosylformylglycinamidine synthase subunit PurQ / glutaminase